MTGSSQPNFYRSHAALKTICAVLHPAFKIFFLILWLTVKKYHYSCWWNSLIFSVQKSKFLSCNILDFYKNYILLSGQFHKLITHIQLIVSIFGILYCCEQLFSKRKHAKIMLLLQLSNQHLCSFCHRLHLIWTWHLFVIANKARFLIDPIYPTPSLEQDMTQGQFLSGV